MADLATFPRSRAHAIKLRVVVAVAGGLLWLMQTTDAPAVSIDPAPSNQAVGTIRKTTAGAGGAAYVVANARGETTHRVQEVPGIDVSRYVGREVVIHGSTGISPGPNGVRWIHPWRIDVRSQPARAENPAAVAIAPPVAPSPAGPAARPASGMRSLAELAFADDLRPAGHVENSAAATSVRTAQHLEGEWAVPPPDPSQREILVPEPAGPDFAAAGPAAGDCPGCVSSPTNMDWRSPRRANLANPCDPPAPEPQWSAAFEATFLEPRFGNNPASTSISNGAGFSDFVQRDFSYDLEFSPRIWLAYSAADGGGLRAQYWQFDHSAAPQDGSPAAGGSLESAFFPNTLVFISTSDPTDVLATTSSLDAYVIDFESIQRVEMKDWRAVFSAGVRFGSIKQTYQAELRDDGGTLLEQIDYSQQFQGAGPTFSIMAARSIFGGLEVFGIARGSLLFGNGDSTLVADDLAAANPLQTTEVTSHSDLLPIGELQFGFSYTGSRWEIFHPFVRAALEAQIWEGAGSATSQDGNLGFFGFTGAAGVTF